ncbi:MAG: hypothetical protein H6863_02540 [Rhodospirillales bacterium]|nr:hypothetical protein [Rhodospirillales bacterium]
MSNTFKKSLRTTVYTTALTVALVSSGGTQAGSINTSPIELTPRGVWSVSKAGGAHPYCTLSKQYDKNIVLTLAENDEQSMTFALDFQKERFEPASMYNIILATDNGDSRSYDSSPANGSAFVIRIKNDAEFYKSLWSSHALSVAVNTENYTFRTADFLDGKSQISTCLSSLTPAVTQAPEVVAGPVPEISHVPVSASQTTEARRAVQMPETASSDSAEAGAGAGPTTTLTPALNATFFAEFERLRQENARLRTSLEAAEQTAQQKSVADDHMISISRDEYAALKQAQTAMQAQISALQHENKELKEGQAESVSVLNQKETESSRKMTAILSENTALKNEASEQKRQLADARKALALAELKIQDYQEVQQQVATGTYDAPSTAQTYAAIEQVADLAPAAGDAAASDELAALKRRNEEQEMEMRRMVEDMATERKAFDAEKARLEKMLFDPAVTSKEQIAYVARLEEELALANKALGEQNPAAAANLASSSSRKRSLLPSPNSMNLSGQIDLKEMGEEITRLRNEIERLRRLSVTPQVEKVEAREATIIMSSPQPKIAQMAADKGQKVDVVTAVNENKPANPAPAPAPMITPAPEEPSAAPAAVVAEQKQPAQIAKMNAPRVVPQQQDQSPESFLLAVMQEVDSSLRVTSRDESTVFWISDAVEGTLVRKTLETEKFEESVNGMIENLKNKCPVPMTIDPLLLRKGDQGNLYAYDADCGTTTISLLFYSNDGKTLSAISYGAPKEGRPDLEKKRERLMDLLMDTLA